ncbi:hypothetical protein REPUB_Repub19eG0089000 [Reevesia pubescens]
MISLHLPFRRSCSGGFSIGPQFQGNHFQKKLGTTAGRLLSQYLDPVLPKFFWFTPIFSNCPTVVEHFLDIKRTFSESNFNLVDFPYFAISFAIAPASLTNCPSFPSVMSMLCMIVPKSMLIEVDFSF